MNKKLELIEHCKNILKHNYKITDSNKVLIIWDESKLAVLLRDSFEKACNSLNSRYELVEFNLDESDNLIENINNNYVKDDIVVLIQTTSFRVSKFRWRNELCSRGLKVVEFGHLNKILEDEFETFINSLTYDYPHFNELNNKLVPLINKSKSIKILSENGSKANYSGPMDKVILNDGNFDGNTNYGSKFPIGEIVTEGLDLSTLNGEIQVYAFPNLDIETEFVEPFKIEIKDGFVVSHNGPKNFEDIVNMIKTEHPEGKVYVREFGIGINRFIPRLSRLGDPISYERQEGLHFSLGMKHGIYEKKLHAKYGKKFFQRYHIDVYVNLDKMYIDDELVYEKEKGYLI